MILILKYNFLSLSLSMPSASLCKELHLFLDSLNMYVCKNSLDLHHHALTYVGARDSL